MRARALACTPSQRAFAASRGAPRLDQHLRYPSQRLSGRVRARASAVESIGIWDVVEYTHPEGQCTTRLGVVAEVGAGQVVVEPLVQTDDGLWVHEDDLSSPTAQVAQEQVMRVLQADYSQRMDSDRRSNPHGEHAHDVWTVLDELGPQLYRGAGS